jgi:energy-coupling factor transporter ATP-binding protein EcfA2
VLTSIRIQNFRGFEEHELPFSGLTVVVGRNNAGKSTIVEALRLLGIISARYRNLPYHAAPKRMNLPARYQGVSPSLRNMEINFDAMFFGYGDPAAKIIGEFSDGASITVFLAAEDQVFGVIRAAGGQLVTSTSMARTVVIPAINIMPQVTPVQAREGILSEDYVRSAMSSRLASLHFRNQIRVLPDLMREFQHAVEETWPGVQILELNSAGSKPGDQLYLQVRNEDFVADIGSMGHGLQMWLQTIWFLVRASPDSTVILDEPDVYMHADLQRRLIRYLKGRYRQVIVATHSIEIMSEVDPSEVLVVERKRSKSNFATSLPAVQRVVSTIGSAQNIQLARLWTSRRALLVEGKDIKILRAFQDTLQPETSVPLDNLPNMSIGGWGGWNYAIGSSMMIRNSLGQEVICYCVLDSDYHTSDSIKRRYDEAKERSVQLHIWSRKEIESYLLVGRAIQAVIAARTKKTATPPSQLDIEAKIDEIADALYDEVFDGTAAEILAENRGLGQGGANKRAREVIKDRVGMHGLRHIVSGKEVLHRLSHWAQSEFGANINPMLVAKEIRPAEVAEEMRRVLKAIANCEKLNQA